MKNFKEYVTQKADEGFDPFARLSHKMDYSDVCNRHKFTNGGGREDHSPTEWSITSKHKSHPDPVVVNYKKGGKNSWTHGPKTGETPTSLNLHLRKLNLSEFDATPMTEDEINEFLGLFGKKKEPETQKGRLYRPGDGPIHMNKAHVGKKIMKRQGGLDYDGIDPDTVPEFQPTWRTAGKS